MNIVACRKEKTSYPDKFYDYWQINRENKFVKKLISDEIFHH